LSEYTVHDITHLDALWGVASEIAGPEYPINPIEGFILGGAILLHDAGMCLAAYPGGVSEITEHPAWRPILRQIAADPDIPSKAELAACIVEFIRREHANRAQQLPYLQWTAPDGSSRMLIEDGDIRQKFGSFIGTIAASHWWSIERVIGELNSIVPAPPPFPTSWSLDLLKIGAILRVADAAHIDERRAPHFLWSLYGNRFNEISKRHWLFQSRLTQPERRNDALYYSSTKPFDITEVNAWWVAYDALNMVNNELRNVDVMLADLRGDENRLAARRVANCETPIILVKSIKAQGWVPIDTSLRISDIPNLIRKLGGEALYGEQPLVALRELIQNAGDALRLRKALQSDFPASSAPIAVEIGEAEGKTYLQISDTGVGMDAEIIQWQLLNFGQSGWRQDPILRDYASMISRIPTVSGKFGIGFFSIFMLGQIVEIITRRFDRGFHETLSLRFENGLASRPILSPASQKQWLMNGGTTVRVWLDEPVALLGSGGVNSENFHDVCCRTFPAFEFPILLRWKDQEILIDGTAWQSEPAHQLLSRVKGGRVSEYILAFAENLRLLHYADGSVAGRMALVPRQIEHVRWNASRYGTVTVNGAASTDMWGFLGVIEGHPLRAARDAALPSIKRDEWANWIAEQTALIKDMKILPEIENDIAETICAFGFEPGSLALCKTAEGWLSADALRQFLRIRDKISVVSSTYIRSEESSGGSINPAPDVIFVASGTPGIFQPTNGRIFGPPEMEIYLSDGNFKNSEEALLSIISEVWNIDYDLIFEFASATVDSFYGKYDVAVPIGRRGDEEISSFAHVYTRDLSRFDFLAIAERAAQDRIESGHYNEYFGNEF